MITLAMLEAFVAAQEADYDEILNEVRGRKAGTLKSSRPKCDGVTAYIWRMCRFHSGIDARIPCTAYFHLASHLEDCDLDDVRMAAFPNADLKDGRLGGKVICDGLDVLVDRILGDLGLDKTKAAEAYKGLLF